MPIPAIVWGTWTNPQQQQQQDAWEALIGRRASIGSQSTSWAQGRNADGTIRYNLIPNSSHWLAQAFTRHAAAGRINYFTWSSWDLANQQDLSFNLPSIIRGDHDAFLHAFARQIAGLRIPIIFRFNAEGNGWWWLNWSELDANGNPQGGNSPGDYVKAWRHVVAIFRAEGATNVAWFWCVNACAAPVSGPTKPTDPARLPSLYPGDDVVDLVGCDAYNWGQRQGQPWLSFADTLLGGKGGLGDTYHAISQIAPSKVFAVGEFATDTKPAKDGGGDYAGWYRQAYTDIPKLFPSMGMVAHFNWGWEIDAAAAAGIRAGLDSSPVWLDAGKFELPAPGTPPGRLYLSGPPVVEPVPATFSSRGSTWPQVAAALSADLGTLRQRIDAATAAQAAAQQQVDNLTANLTRQTSRADTAEAHAADLAGQVDSLTARATTAEARITDVQTHLTALVSMATPPAPPAPPKQQAA